MFLLLIPLITLLAAQQPSTTVWSGVYTSAQAARGKTHYDAACSRCHGADLNGGVGRSLKADAFIRDWTGENLNTLFSRIKNSMPPGAPSSLSDDAYLEIVTYILQANVFPDSETAELKTDALKDIRIEGKDGPDAAPNFSLVHVVGCLTQGPDRAWMLTDASEPARTRDPAVSKGDELKKSAATVLGSQTFRLLYIFPDPDPYKGHKVEAKGFLIKMPNDDRINVTSLQTLAPTCK